MSYTGEPILNVLIIAFYLLSLVVAVGDYVMVSLSLYTMSKNRGIRGAGLAWVPVANFWIVGSLANEADAQKGVQRKWNTLLLTFALIGLGGLPVVFIGLTAVGILYYFVAADLLLWVFLLIYGILIVDMIAMVALSILSSICIFKIFESVVPQKAVKYILLYLLVPLGAGICLLKTRNADEPIPPMETLTKAEEML
ncbi:MAG: hypothetical protein II351_01240 [Clostridia bacterium]|nr:hypothetical protein [Clostridia bacterium]